MTSPQVTVDEVAMLIGQQRIEIFALQKQVARLEALLAEKVSANKPKDKQGQGEQADQGG